MFFAEPTRQFNITIYTFTRWRYKQLVYIVRESAHMPLTCSYKSKRMWCPFIKIHIWHYPVYYTIPGLLYSTRRASIQYPGFYTRHTGYYTVPGLLYTSHGLLYSTRAIIHVTRAIIQYPGYYTRHTTAWLLILIIYMLILCDLLYCFMIH